MNAIVIALAIFGGIFVSLLICMVYAALIVASRYDDQGEFHDNAE